MSLMSEKILRTEDLAATDDERALRRCRRAEDLQEAGRHEEARAALGDLWRRVGERPETRGLGARAAAEVLLRAGSVAGFVGSARQIEGAQEFAKNVISESASRFRELGEGAREAEALRELGYCYWREGGYDEARVVLGESLARLPQVGCEEQRAQTLLRLAIVESSSARMNDALRILTQAAPLFESGAGDAKRGTFHMELAVVLATLAEDERREDYSDRALLEFAAATHYFERAGHARYLAAAENNFAFFLFKRGRFAEAREHLDHARALFARLRDAAHAAQVDETRARVLLAEGRAAEAESAARAAARALAAGGEQAILAEALATQGRALARLGRTEEARVVLARAARIAELAGDLEGAGLTELTTLEELSDALTPAQMRELYDSADRLLARTERRETLARLRECARRVVAAVARAGENVAAGEIESFAAQECARLGKVVRFTPAALDAMLRLPCGADAQSLRALVTRTVERAEDGAEIEASAVETVALRHRVEGADFAAPWANFAFKDEVRRFEERLIEQALLDARGSVSRAARLLGFRHHESLNWRLKNRNRALLEARTPARKRRRSIIRKHD
ncbi:MAG: helix-turn-helix domain-containing protein [Pyrinomonadaceae bacterium]